MVRQVHLGVFVQQQPRARHVAVLAREDQRRDAFLHRQVHRSAATRVKQQPHVSSSSLRSMFYSDDGAADDSLAPPPVLIGRAINAS